MKTAITAIAAILLVGSITSFASAEEAHAQSHVSRQAAQPQVQNLGRLRRAV